jgi:hypothetical protein
MWLGKEAISIQGHNALKQRNKLFTSESKKKISIGMIGSGPLYTGIFIVLHYVKLQKYLCIKNQLLSSSSQLERILVQVEHGQGNLRRPEMAFLFSVNI